MPRLPRLELPGIPLHVTQRGVNRCAIFLDDDDRRHYRRVLREAARRHAVAIHAFALMDSHVHLLSPADRAGAISQALRRAGALDMALVQRRSEVNVVLHHDRGSQYKSARYRAKAEAANITLSMSRPGMPYDNAVAESFFRTLKLELIPGGAFSSREAARLAVLDYIETFYNRARMHSALHHQCPKNLGHSTPSPLSLSLHVEWRYHLPGSPNSSVFLTREDPQCTGACILQASSRR